jgi:hypothetical protein
MALTDFTISDADVGRVLPISDGFLVTFRGRKRRRAMKFPIGTKAANVGRPTRRTSRSRLSASPLTEAQTERRLCGRDHGAFRPG